MKTTICNSESGQGLTEYLILLILIAVGSIAVVKSLGDTIQNKIKHAKSHILKDVSFE